MAYKGLVIDGPMRAQTYSAPQPYFTIVVRETDNDYSVFDKIEYEFVEMMGKSFWILIKKGPHTWEHKCQYVLDELIKHYHPNL